MKTKNRQLNTFKDTLLVVLVLVGIVYSDYLLELIVKYILN